MNSVPVSLLYTLLILALYFAVMVAAVVVGLVLWERWFKWRSLG
jgi:hypothetical protein